MKRRIYIAGPMTGYPNFNYDSFNKAEEEWQAAGWAVANPARHFDGAQDLPYEEYIREAILDLIESDAVVLLPGWYDSFGANTELVVARALSLPIYAHATGTAYEQPGAPFPNAHRLVQGRVE